MGSLLLPFFVIIHDPVMSGFETFNVYGPGRLMLRRLMEWVVPVSELRRMPGAFFTSCLEILGSEPLFIFLYIGELLVWDTSDQNQSTHPGLCFDNPLLLTASSTP